MQSLKNNKALRGVQSLKNKSSGNSLMTEQILEKLYYKNGMHLHKKNFNILGKTGFIPICRSYLCYFTKIKGTLVTMTTVVV